MKTTYFIILLAFTISVSAQQRSGMDKNHEKDSTEFSIYPNPAFDDVVYINSGHYDNKQVTVFDVFGKVVLRERIATGTLNISRLVPGVYVLQLRENEKTMSRKLVVK
ncbi:T9SS type A sorting domain-containing protein [Zeaxanthinibacter enoshimensis]|uniref:Putative secreted protein (Por secretion system target) n=1 Tax=Zeaxanthinibacter enoshimensis TaxID=392009 RepID=A0A4R6TSB3_9FLAO|nr:T9SS type A sorting domain-containing protein [Zeaxanthinibacter enoshimensis]TDQ33217.1 putative secreted protein (Por secretion system target) [Zeaxanthinibacter enoshimensis]